MMKATLMKTLLAGSALIAAGAANVSAQETVLHRDGMPAEQFRKAQQLRNSLGADDDATRGVYFKGTEWPPSYQRIRVCFFGGSKELRAKIADVASEWMKTDNSIKLDFGKSKNRSCKKDGSGPEMQIRIGFSEPGFWSYVGIESVVYRRQSETSMNLGSFDKYPVEQLNDYAIGTIRHEFGHALGLQHEHQNPRSSCNADFDWDKIYKLMSEGENGWPKEQVDFNMRPLSGDGLVATKFNKHSVMLYSFPAQFYKKGEKSGCYIPHDNNKISKGDRDMLAAIYSTDAKARLERFEATKAEFSSMLDKKAEEGTKGVTINVMQEFFGRAGNSGEVDDE